MSASSNVIKFPASSVGGEPACGDRRVGPEFVAEPAQPSHFVQFYEEEESLLERVGHFLAAGARSGDRLLVIATPERRDGVLRRLEALGAYAAVRSGQVTWLDARQMLLELMVDDRPDPVRFRTLLSRFIPGPDDARPHPFLRAYGEMVDLLWRSGNSEGAVRLEELWNELGKDHEFSLFCAYAIGHFYKEGESSRFYDVCRSHTHIIPTESFARQKALEKEVAHRSELEDALRGALGKRTQAEEELRACLRREQEACARAEEAVRFQELFVGTLGHDLRNPLNTILNTARVMTMRGEVLAEGRARLERVIANATRMQRMIEQILDLARARLAGGIPVDRSWRDLDALTVKIVAAARAANPAREISYRKRGDCWAGVDEARIEQVVSNLMSNAVTHGAPDRPVAVELSGSTLAVQLSVHNEGPPIDPGFMPHLFDPFARTEKAKGRSGGLGLGLYIVDRIVKAHDGIISASSSVETGTVFEATIPKYERFRSE